MTTMEGRVVRLETIAEETSKNIADIRSELRSIRMLIFLMWLTTIGTFVGLFLGTS